MPYTQDTQLPNLNAATTPLPDTAEIVVWVVGASEATKTTLGTLRSVVSAAVVALDGDLRNVSNSINTSNKYLGKEVYVSDIDVFAQATGANPSDKWIGGAGVYEAIPV